ncbi:hypothetical protein K7432_018605, partial [Basidiobolus ranarum]
IERLTSLIGYYATYLIGYCDAKPLAGICCTSAGRVGSAPINESSSVGKVTLATGKNGAVAADSHICSEAGVQILKSNGNAIDAAIATAL